MNRADWIVGGATAELNGDDRAVPGRGRPGA